MRLIQQLLAVTVLTTGPPAPAQMADGPRGMYCGGNEYIEMGKAIHASSVAGTVIDLAGGDVPSARVQVQIKGTESLLHDVHADVKGRFHLRLLKPGTY